MQHDASADRAAHDHRLVEFERVRDVHDHAHVIARGELILRILPAGRRRGFAVPWHVESDDTEVCRHARIVHQSAILPRVRTGSVQAEQGNAPTRFLDKKPVRFAEQVEMKITAGGWLETRIHRAGSRRGAAITSLKYKRSDMNGCRSPSTRINFCLTSANMSVKPGGGSGCQNFSQTACEARSAKL